MSTRQYRYFLIGVAIEKPANQADFCLTKRIVIEYNHGAATRVAPAMPRSSSGPGRRPFKAEITGSTPVRGTILERSLAYPLILVCQASLHLPLCRTGDKPL